MSHVYRNVQIPHGSQDVGRVLQLHLQYICGTGRKDRQCSRASARAIPHLPGILLSGTKR